MVKIGFWIEIPPWDWGLVWELSIIAIVGRFLVMFPNWRWGRRRQRLAANCCPKPFLGLQLRRVGQRCSNRRGHRWRWWAVKWPPLWSAPGVLGVVSTLFPRRDKKGLRWTPLTTVPKKYHYFSNLKMYSELDFDALLMI